MITPTIVGITSIILSTPNNLIKSNLARIFIGFTPIFFFLALRHNYGNDYSSYLEIFEEISLMHTMNYDSNYWHAEVGWLLLNRIFSGIGFFSMITSLALINCYIYARFIIQYVPTSYYWLSIFLYLFIPENMLVQSSGMRQSVAITLFLIATDFVIKKDILRYLIVIVTASLFHTSALLLIPIYFIGIFNISIKKYWIPIFLIAYFILFYYSESIVSAALKTFISVNGSLFERYEIYNEKGSIGSGFGVIFYAIYLTLLLYHYNFQKSYGKFIFKMSIIAIYLIPFAVEIGMLARIGFYFSIFSIASIPLIAAKIEKKLIRICFIGLHILYALWGYFQFFQNPVWRKSFSEYHSILEFVF